MAMLELVATSNETDDVSRQQVDGQRMIRLGRSPEDGWAIRWDPRISAEHADLYFEGEAVRVVRLPRARNKIYHEGEPQADFLLAPGESFRIGRTTFHLFTVTATEDTARATQADEQSPEMVVAERVRDALLSGNTRADDEVNSRDAEIAALKDQLASMEQLLQVEVEARKQAETRAERLLDEAVQELARETALRQAETKTRESLEEQLQQALAEVASRHAELQARHDAELEAKQIEDEAQALKEKVELLERELTEHDEEKRSDQAKIEKLSKHELEANSLRAELQQMQAALDEKIEAQRRAEDEATRLAEAEAKWRAEEATLRAEVAAAQRKAEDELSRHKLEAEAARAEVASMRTLLDEREAAQQAAEQRVGELLRDEQQRAEEAERRRTDETRRRQQLEDEATSLRADADSLQTQVAELTELIQSRVEAQQRSAEVEQEMQQETRQLQEQLRQLQEQAEVTAADESLAREQLESCVASERERLAQEQAERLEAQRAREQAEAEANRRRGELTKTRQELASLQERWQQQATAQQEAQQEAERWRLEAETLREKMQLLASVAPTRRTSGKRPSVTAESTDFDPYHRWLGIAPDEQPPDHYRLLALTRFEEDHDIIADAADRQMEYVRRKQHSKHVGLCETLLGELATARLCLLDAAKKQAYDEQLWGELEAAQPAIVTSEQDAATLSQSLSAAAFEDYNLEDYITETRHGHVFKVQHRMLGRPAAMAVLSDVAACHPQLSQRFRLKSQLLARADHPYLTSVLDAGHRDGMHYLVMELVEGEHLIDMLKREGALPVDQAMRLTLQTAATLQYLHSRGVIHRNVKPSNILYGNDSTFKLVGLSSARYLDSPLIDQSQLEKLDDSLPAGTLDYMAPEQAEDSACADAKSDIYSLGCTMFTLLTRRLVFPGQDPNAKRVAHREHEPPSIRVLRPEVPEVLNQVFQKMVSKDPDDRLASAEEVIGALTGCGYELPSL